MRNIKLAIWKPSKTLLNNLNKLDNSNEIVGIFDSEETTNQTNNCARGAGQIIGYYDEEKIKHIEFDYILICTENYRQTKDLLSQKYQIKYDKIHTFEEYWVNGCENRIVCEYHKKWEKLKEADINVFKNKTVLVLGGNSGIGKEAAHCFLLNGARVIVAGRDLEKLKATCLEYGVWGEIDYYQWDVTDVSLYKVKLEQLLHRINRIDVIVNSVGIWDKYNKEFFDVSESEFDDIINTNLKASYFINQLFANYFIKERIKGHIVNVISNVGTLPTVKPYGISKWGLMGLVKGLGLNLAEYGITVNGVAPGAVATELAGWKEGDCPARRAAKNGRITFPCEIAEIIVSLAGTSGEIMNGEVIVADGGDKSINLRL